MPRAKVRTPELRDRVRDVAVATLADHGVAGFTARRIAEAAATSVPAVYELFGDKSGLVRAVFLEGFRRLDHEFEQFVDSDDARADLERIAFVFRDFALDNPLLFEVMFSRPFADFDPAPDELAAGASVRRFLVAHARRAVDSGAIDGDPADLAHVLVALAHGLAARQSIGVLGSTREAVDRRWRLAFRALLEGLAPR